MKISKVIVENYRSLQRVEIDPSRFSVFVGQNNHGKTNFFEAIEWFYTSKSSTQEEHFRKIEANRISVTLFFNEVVEADIEKITSDATKTKIRNLLEGETSFSVVKTSTDHKRRYFVNGVDKGNPQGLDPAINEFIPKLEYVNTKICLDDVAKYKDKNAIGAMLSGVLTSIIEVSPEYRDFKNTFSTLFDAENSQVRVELDRLGTQVEVYLQKQFPDGTRVKFAVSPPQFSDLLKTFETTVDDGIETRADAKGDGMQRAIMLSIIQAFADYRKQQLGGGSFLFMIDEAELHLHPSAQRSLRRALLDICTTDQVLVNTHSSVFVVENDPLQKIFKVEKTEGITGIVEVDDFGKPDVIFELLGGSPADLLLPRNFLIVEGRSEFEFISTIVRRFYADIFRGIKIIFAGGDIEVQAPTLVAVHRLFMPLAGSENPIYRNKAVVLNDRPNARQQANYDSFQRGYPYLFENNQVFELPTTSLEEYYPTPYTKTYEESRALGREKVAYAKTVASEITLEEFEQSMPLMHHALVRCNELAF